MSSDDRFERWSRPAAGVLTVAGLAILAHVEVLGLWFTGADTIPLIESSRVRSLGDVAALLAEPLMAGTTFAEGARFYRPLVTLSFGLDYALWGLDPTGYHLTDLFLHATATALVFLLVREFGDGDDLAGVLAGIVFGLHPLTIEVIPSPARRQDVLATAFVVLSVLLFVRGLRRDNRRLVVASAGASLLALGSKETAIVLPVLVAAWFLLHEVDGGIGMVDGGIEIRDFLRRSVAYGSPFAVATAVYFAVRLSVLGGVGGYVGRHGRAPVADLATRYVRSLVYPVDHLYIQLGVGVRIVPDGLLVVAVVCTLLALAVVARRGGEALRSDRVRRLCFLGVWAVVPFGLIAYTGRYALRSGYLSLVPVGAVVGLLVAPTLRRAAARSRALPGEGPELAAALLALLLATSLLAGSPLLRPYDGWEHAGDVTRGAIEEVETHSDAFPRGATVSISGVPHSRSAREVTDLPRARSVTYLWSHTVTSWFRLRDPDSDVTFSVNDTAVVPHRRVDVRSTVRSSPSGPLVELDYDPVPTAIAPGSTSRASTEDVRPKTYIRSDS